jgi:hypothetical protein
MNNEDIVLSYELENYFLLDSHDTYDENPEHFLKKLKAKRKEKLASMTDEERTARRKKFQKILKIGVGVGAVIGAIAFGPQLIAMLGPTFPAMKSALTKQGLDVKKMKKGEIIKTFFEKIVKGKEVEGDGEKKGMGMVKAILEFFKNAKARKDKGEATALDNLILSEADKTTKKLFDAPEGSEAEVMDDVINTGTADQTTTTNSGTGSGSGMDMKSMLPIIVIVLAALFFLKR